MPQDQYKNLFKPFFRLDKSRSLNKSGIGLGLAIVRKIIEQHDGSLNLYNSSTVLHKTFNKGVIAVIKLPLILKKDKFHNENILETDLKIKEKIKTL